MATTVTTVRMDEDTLKALRERAKREGRSMSSLITTILKRSVLDDDGKPSFVGVLRDVPVPELEDFRAIRARLNAAMRIKRKAR